MSRAFHRIVRHTPLPECTPEQAKANIESHDWVEIDLTDRYLEADAQWAPLVACSKCEFLRWTKSGGYTAEAYWPCGEAPPSIPFDEYLDSLN